jgi:ribose 5-phosphate isomerase B
MRIALGADENLPLVAEITRYLEERGLQVDKFGAASSGKQEPWARVAATVGEAVARKEYDFGIVCCWTGTGVTMAANKVPRVRAALCADAQTARGARKWNDANVLGMSLRATSPAVAREILDAWLDEDYDGTEDESISAIRELEEPHSSGDSSRSSAR